MKRRDSDVSYVLNHKEAEFMSDLAKRHPSVAAILSAKLEDNGKAIVLRLNFDQCLIIQGVLTNEVLAHGLVDGSDLDPIGKFIEDLRYKFIW